MKYFGLELVRALYYEVNASVFAACGELSFFEPERHAW